MLGILLLIVILFAAALVSPWLLLAAVALIALNAWASGSRPSRP